MSFGDEEVGLLQVGSITGYDPVQNVMQVTLTSTTSIKAANAVPIDVSYAPSLFNNNGLFVGTYPEIGTPVVIGQGSGGRYHFVCFLAEDLSAMPDLSTGTLLIRGNDSAKITLDITGNISIGSDTTRIHTNTGDKDNPDTNLISLNFKNENHFTQAYREVGGLIKRDIKFKSSFDQNSKLENDDYDSEYQVIGLDSSIPANNVSFGSSKNPPLVEHRELVYEFQYDSDVTNDLKESSQYGTSKPNSTRNTFPNRRKSRADTLSLTLLEPNYLMETIKGTVVDIFGNILDLNRVPLPIGKDKNTLNTERGADKQAAYLKIKELERKSLAFHFEINARKDLASTFPKESLLDILDINSNKDNSRIRSRFFVDIDKEGQFKINIPASSEKGNIPLLTRYENFSTYSPEDDGNPNKLIFRNDNLDIFQDSFAAQKTLLGASVGFSGKSIERGTIKLKNDKGEAAPNDRITNVPIMHGTAHHNILDICNALSSSAFIDYQYGTNAIPTVDITTIPLLTNIVSDTIKIAGNDANAGGRSGSINLDGMLEFNVGANTIDRQSLWADFAGGSVIMLGRDRNSRSAVVHADGDVYMQIGNFGLTGDSRFVKDANGTIAAVFDVRIMTSGSTTHMLRFDDTGVILMTPGTLSIHSVGNMKIQSDANIDIDCEQLTVQERGVMKVFGGSV